MRHDSFKDFVLDQLSGLGEVSAKAMFGGWGLYSEGLFFGIIYRERLYFKTDPGTRPGYVRAGSKPFTPRRGQTLKNYYDVPVEVIEDPDRLAHWARGAITAGK